METLSYFVIDRVETGNRIYAYRKDLHLSRERLARALLAEGIEISVNSIGKWERGEVDISYVYARALANIFGCRLYGGLVIFCLRDFDGERDQPVSESYYQDERVFGTRSSFFIHRRLMVFMPHSAIIGVDPNFYSGGNGYEENKNTAMD